MNRLTSPQLVLLFACVSHIMVQLLLGKSDVMTSTEELRAGVTSQAHSNVPQMAGVAFHQCNLLVRRLAPLRRKVMLHLSSHIQ